MESIRNLYQTPDLNGDFLIQPLKTYNDYFEEKIDDTTSFVIKSLWVITQVVLGILAYPIFALLATIGLLIKLQESPSITKHNKFEIDTNLGLIQTSVNGTGGFSDANHSIDSIPGYKKTTIQKFYITRANDTDAQCEKVAKVIKDCSAKYRKIWLQSKGEILNDGSGQIILKIVVLDPIKII